MISTEKHNALKALADPLGIRVLVALIGGGVMLLTESGEELYDGDEAGATAVLVAKSLAENGLDYVA